MSAAVETALQIAMLGAGLCLARFSYLYGHARGVADTLMAVRDEEREAVAERRICGE